MIKRKEMKRCGRSALKRHYLLYMAVCLIAAFISAEFAGSLTLPQATVSPAGTEAMAEEQPEAGAVAETAGVPAAFSPKITLTDVLEQVLLGDTQTGRELSEKLKEEAISKAEESNPAFGRSRGVLSALVNQITSGSLLVTAAAAINSLTGSESAGAVFLILGGTLCYLMFWFLLQNMYVVISRRIFLEGRLYSEIPFQRFAYLLRVKKWLKVSLTMLLTAVFRFLWALTIVGGLIKHYSYYLVPYIIAENPDIAPRQAIRLSRKMMQGHKWECFVFELSFLGWEILGVLTMGLTDLFFTNPYKVAAFSEYYVELRRLAKECGIPGTELLNDTWLYQRPDEEVLRNVYGDVLEVMERPRGELERLGGFRGFLANTLGVLAFRTAKERKYERDQAERIRYEDLFEAACGRAYPSRLFSIPEEQRRKMVESLHYMRHYSIWSLVVMFFAFSFIGWLWEVSLHLITDGTFVNRGVMYGPWLPIYGSGGVLILTLLHRLKSNPAAEFTAIVVLCGTVEYVTAYVLEHMTGGLKWWDYSGYFLNLHGRICAEGLLVFGLGGLGIVYVLAPVIDNALARFRERRLRILCILLMLVFLGDAAWSMCVPNQGDGITDYR